MTRRPWVTAYRRRKTWRVERCAAVTPPDHHRCRRRVEPGQRWCPLHRPEDTP